MFKPDNALYRCEQIKFCEQQAVNRYHLNDYELMTQAGTEAFFFYGVPILKHVIWLFFVAQVTMVVMAMYWRAWLMNMAFR